MVNRNDKEAVRMLGNSKNREILSATETTKIGIFIMVKSSNVKSTSTLMENYDLKDLRVIRL